MNRTLTALFLLGFAILPAQAQRGAPAAAAPANPFIGKPEAVGEGVDLYNENCAACHGLSAGGSQNGPRLIFNITTALRAEMTDAQMLTTVRNGIAGSLMPAFQNKLADDQILKIGAYLHSLRSPALDNPLPGDVAHGEEIFWGKGQCGSCHIISGRGGLIGPDLTDLAARRKPTAIINALTQPGHRNVPDGGAIPKAMAMMDSYDAVHVVPKTGKPFDGVTLAQDNFSIQILGTDNQLHLMDRDDIRTLQARPSFMPTDYDKRLSTTEFKDLLAFLTRQGRASAAAAPGRGAAAGPD